MRRWHGGYVTRVLVPAKILLQRFGFLALVIAGLTMMVLNRTENAAIEGVRTGVIDFFVPILDAVSRPVATVREIGAGIDEIWSVRAENQRLAEANARLRRWEAVARQLAAENIALRELLQLAPEARGAFISARVVGDSGSAFVRTVLINAGARDGVAKGQAVISGDGLVGRIVEVGVRSSRVLLITDLNSRVPVLLEGTRSRAILAGDNSETAFLDLLPPDAAVEMDARVATSGHGGLFQPGLPVGIVVSVEPSSVRVKPFVDLERLEYVRVIDWRAPEFTPMPLPSPAAIGRDTDAAAPITVPGEPTP